MLSAPLSQDERPCLSALERQTLSANACMMLNEHQQDVKKRPRILKHSCSDTTVHTYSASRATAGACYLHFGAAVLQRGCQGLHLVLSKVFRYDR